MTVAEFARLDLGVGLKSRLNQCLYKDRDKNNKSQKFRFKTLARPIKFTLKQFSCRKFCYFGRNFPKLPQFTTFSMSPEILSIIFFVLPTFDFFPAYLFNKLSSHQYSRKYPISCSDS